jgi:general transcription factor 3C polypeptide 5 (transcription factor C subunit 1)
MLKRYFVSLDLCDFQYIPLNLQFDSHGPAVCNYSNLVPIGLPTFSWLRGDAPHFLPPATFSRMDTMQVRVPYCHVKCDTLHCS